jgi:hypothetical protein
MRFTEPDDNTRAAYRDPLCPRCSGRVTRIPRRSVDVLISAFTRTRRYRCRSPGCGWEGNLRARRQPLLFRGRG